MKVISIANQKGGIGKTTLTVLLCNTLSQEPYNLNIKLLDIDFQKSAFFLRETDSKSRDKFSYDIIQFNQIKDQKAFFKLLADLSETTDYLFIDPPGNVINLEPFILSLDYCFIPFKAGDFDFHSTLEFIKFFKEHSKKRKSFDLPESEMFYFINDYVNTSNFKNMLQFFHQNRLEAKPLTFNYFNFNEIIKIPHRTFIQNINSYDSIESFDKNHFNEFYHFAQSINNIITGQDGSKKK